MPSTLSINELTVSRGARVVLDRVTLRVAPGRRVGLIGPNGVGKSTLLAACAGEVAADFGEVVTTPPSATIGWLRQEPQRDRETVRELLDRRTGVSGAQRELDRATEALAVGRVGADDRYDAALERWLSLGAADFEARLGEVADDLGFSERLLVQTTGSLSGGEAARVGLAALLLSRFDIHLLDEPTNDLDGPGLERLERWVLDRAGPVLLVSHDRRFMDRVVTDVAEVDEFTHQLTVFGGGWQAYLDERERARRHAWERYEEYDAERTALARRNQRQREWVQQGQAKVRRSANDEPDKNIRTFRMDQTEQLAGKAARTRRAMERLEPVDKPREPWQLRLDVPDAPRSGDIVARLSDVVVEHDTSRVVSGTSRDTSASVDVGRDHFRLGPIDLLVGYGERIALLGHNGAGKSTLIDVVLGRTAPDRGTSVVGAGVRVGEIEQVRRQLVGAASLGRVFVDATGLDVGDARTLLAKFGLVGDHVERSTESLSPGERTRASLALLMANGANLLVLDEPTNHLDLPAIEQLEQALETFAGTILLVTHDRVFLESVRVTRTIELADGRLIADRAT